MLEVKNLTRKFGNLLAVDNVSFEINEGEVFGFLGPNGAGKTTAMRMLTSLISKTQGRVVFDGLDTDKPEDRTKIRGMTGLLPESPGLYEKLSVYRNLEFYADIYGVGEKEKKERIEHYLKMLDLWDRRNEKVAEFSKGMKQKVAIVRALLHEPKYLFLDEPTAGLDPEAARTVRELILEIKKKDRIIFLNTHNLDEAQKICDRVGIIKQRLLATDSPGRLETKLYHVQTLVRLEKINPMILKAVKKVKGVKKVARKGSELVLTVSSESINPQIVDAIVRNRGRILSVEPKRHSLEDIYFRLVGEK